MMKMFSVLLAFMFASLSAHAAGPDMTALTSAVDFGTVTVAILAVAAILAVVYVAIKGAKIMLAMIKSG